jgi:hypothetical protein
VPIRFRPLVPALLAAALPLGGCATLCGDADQAIHIQTVDANDRTVSGMRCHVSNAVSDYFGDSPMVDLRVRRSSSDLVVECRSRGQVAQATAVSRGHIDPAFAVASAVLPGGAAAFVIDRISGKSYTYPSWIRLQVGRSLVFDANDSVAGQPTRALQANNQP